MTDDLERNWEESVDRALKSFCERGYWRLDPAGLNEVHKQLCSLRTKIPVRWPMEPIAVHSIGDVSMSTTCTMQVVLMVQRGYRLGEAMLFWRNLRFSIAEEINPHAMQLWTRDQIVETLGEAFGGPVARAIAEPGSNPLLHAIMFKKHGEAVYRSAALVWSEVEIDSRPVRIGVPSGIVQGQPLMPDVPVAEMPVETAAQLYERVTNGGYTDFTFYLDPMELDYAAEAEKAQKALWEAHGSGDPPFGGRAPESRRKLRLWSL